MTKNIKVSAIVSSYKGGKYLPAFLENAAEQTARNYLEVILVHNDPSQAEIDMVKSYQERYPGLINHIIVAREPLAVSTNRAIKAAAGDYICIWNIDDLRTIDSIELMVRMLDRHSNTDFTYGDYCIVNRWLAKEGRYITTPEFKKNEFIRSMHLGPFYMWRKSLCDSMGYWDEQCLQGGDFEYAARLAVESDGIKTHGLLGYYLDEGMGLSTKRATLQPIEQVFVELRYGAYRKIDFLYLSRALQYNILAVREGDAWKDINMLAPHRKQLMDSKTWYVYAVVRYPFWILWRIMNKIRRKFYGLF